MSVSLSRRARWVAAAAAVALVVAAGVITLVLNGSSAGNGLPADPLRFYSAGAVSPIEREIAPVEKRADQLTAKWIAKHGTSNDTGFASYAVRQVGAVPGSAVQTTELGQLRTLQRQRTAEGIAAATYLEAHGKKDVWQTYGDAYDALPGHGHDAENLIDAADVLGTEVADRAQATYQRLPPYQVDPSLNGTIHRDASRVKYSFPSGHATLAGAEATVLARLEPQRVNDLRFLEGEVDYSRLYVAAHYPSDIVRGALLGRMIGDYTLADHHEWVPGA
ncbi:MAG: phosphatase PAP2 family protein [Frankiaceae bacterium]|nr:phosphatase PAP2 family protein [Frankiaceae bacterium]MBV9870495.1 phosphatase PAP2 family protein [Frankiaceae bacterium]